MTDQAAEAALTFDDLEIAPTEPPEEEEPAPLRFEISSYPADYTLRVLYDKWQSRQLVVPDFQRNYVWTRSQASRLIESFLLGLPVPGVFLYKESATQRLLVVDGQQRLTSVRFFIDGVFKDGNAFRLTNVAERWEGKGYADLSEPDRFRLDDSILRATVMQQLDPNDQSSVYLLFERLNAGGTQLNPMEIRKCLYSGDAFTMLEELNHLVEWRAVLNRTRPDPRYRDVELVLRVLAMVRRASNYEKPMKVFLTKYMKELADSADERRRARRLFRHACQLTTRLPDLPFHIRTRLNLAALDSTLATLSSYPVSRAEELPRRFERLIEDQQYQEAITFNTSDVASVEGRFKRARAVLLS